MFLTTEEVAELTGRQRSDAQVRALRFMGIEHKVRPDGSVAVLRAHVERIFGGAIKAPERKTGTSEPDWAALEEMERLQAAKRKKK